MIRLAIAEDHTIVRWALREALSKADDIEVVGEAGTAAETLEMVKRERPDVLILDISLPDRSGFDVLTEMRPMDTAPLVVVLTWHTEPSYAARAIAAGAHGYVNKAVEPDELRQTGLSWRKVSTLRDLAKRLSDGRLDPDVLSALPDDELMAELTAVPGIGPWTVQGALLIALQREDVVLPGDLALRKAVQAAYLLDHLPSQQEVLAVAERVARK